MRTRTKNVGEMCGEAAGHIVLAIAIVAIAFVFFPPLSQAAEEKCGHFRSDGAFKQTLCVAEVAQSATRNNASVGGTHAVSYDMDVKPNAYCRGNPRDCARAAVVGMHDRALGAKIGLAGRQMSVREDNAAWKRGFVDRVVKERVALAWERERRRNKALEVAAERARTETGLRILGGLLGTIRFLDTR